MSFIACKTTGFGLSQLVLSSHITVWEGATSDFWEESLQHWDGTSCSRLGLCLPDFVFNCPSIFPSPGDLSDVWEEEREERVPVSGEVFWFVVLCRRQRWFLTSNIRMDAVVFVAKRWGLERNKPIIRFQNCFSPWFKGDTLIFSCIYRL